VAIAGRSLVIIGLAAARPAMRLLVVPRARLRLGCGRLLVMYRVRLESATSEQLDVWTERVLTAATLDEVFAP
jgi:hypothetical protein